MKMTLAVMVLLCMSPVLRADPQLTWEWVDVGEGLRGYTVSVSDDQFASWAVNLDFWGCCGTPLRQMRDFVFDVNFKPEDIIIDPPYPAPYRASLDSWIFAEWVALATGVDGPPDAPFHMHVGTPAGEAMGTIPLAYLVIEEDGCICWDGIVARQGVDYPTSGQIPEPAMCVLLASGLVVMRRRRSSRNTSPHRA
jgi:hypothetical protein